MNLFRISVFATALCLSLPARAACVSGDMFCPGALSPRFGDRDDMFESGANLAGHPDDMLDADSPYDPAGAYEGRTDMFETDSDAGRYFPDDMFESQRSAPHYPEDMFGH